MNELYKEALKFHKQSRLVDAERKLLRIEPGDTDFVLSKTLLLRCYLEQGKIGEALSLVNLVSEVSTKLPSGSSDVPVEQFTELRLWSSMAMVYGTQDWAGHIDFCDRIISAGETQVPLAADLKLQGEIFRDVLTGRIAPRRNREIFDEFGRVADLYERASLTGRCLWAKFKQADFGSGKDESLRTEAVRIFGELKNLSEEEGAECERPLIAAFAELSLAEADFAEAHADISTVPDYAILATKFENAASRLMADEHPFAEELTILRLGIILLKYGFGEGTDLIQKVLPAIEKAENYKLVDAGLRNLETWFINHGNYAEEVENRAKIKALGKKMQFGLSTAVDELGERNLAFRKGETAAAVKSSENSAAAERSVLLNTSGMLNAALAMNSAGRVEDSRSILEQVIQILESNDSFQNLGEAWASYGSTFISDDFNKAVECATKAIEIERIMNEEVALAQRYAFRAWLRVQGNRIEKISPALSAEANDDFDTALGILQKERTLDGRNALISLCQMRGQAAMINSDWNNCGHYLTKAEELANELKLNPQIAFTLNYQGLALIQIARTASPEKNYLEAKKKFRRAEDIFREAGLFGLTWRPVYHQALCEYESGERIPDGDEQRNERFQDANRLLKRAVAEINNLYALTTDDASPAAVADISAASDFSLERYKGSLPFLIDKQGVFGIGFQLARHYLRDSAETFWWLEQMKARNLIRFLASRISVDELQAGMAVADGETGEPPSLEFFSNLRKGLPAEWSDFRDYLQKQQERLEGRKILAAEYYCSPLYSMVLLMRPDWDFPVFEKLSVDYRNLESFAADHFKRKGGVRQMLEDIGEDQWQSFSALVEPLDRHSAPEDVICLIPHGMLHNLPLHTLKIQDRYLIERNPVYYSPSASFLCYLNKEAAGSGAVDDPASAEKIEVFGNPTKDLSFAEQEAKAIAGFFSVKANVRESATRENFIDAIRRADIVHFAGHGELTAENGFLSKLFLAGKQELTAADILNLRTNAELIVLSGCETGLSERYANADELIGLMASFLAIGANALIVSQWRVNDESSKVLLEEFYRIWKVRGKTKPGTADALRIAVEHLRKQEKWASFYHWGGFVLCGECF